MSEGNEKGEEKSQDSEWSGAYITVSILLSVGAAALLGLHFWSPQLVDAWAVTLLVVGFLPWLRPVFESVTFPGGGSVTWRKRVEAKQERQADQIKALQFLTANLLPGDQLLRLKELDETGTNEFGPGTPNMSASLEALGRLQLGGFIQRRPEQDIKVRNANFQTDTVKLDWYDITDRGREFLQILAKLNKP